MSTTTASSRTTWTPSFSLVCIGCGMAFVLLMILFGDAWNHLSQMWKVGLIMCPVAGLYCLTYFDGRKALVATVATFIPFLLTTILAAIF